MAEHDQLAKKFAYVLGFHTPASTLVISRTLKPFSGRVPSFPATTTKLRCWMQYVNEHLPLERAIVRETLTRDREEREAMLICTTKR